MAPSPSTTPADCFAHVALLRREIDELRSELGRPAGIAHVAVIQNAEPRECWIAGLTLVSRADRLAQEAGLDGARAPISATPLPATRPADVLALLHAATARVALFKSRLGAGGVASPPATETLRTPSEVLTSILEASRALDRLLERPTTPGDVFAEVSRASGYASALMLHAGVADPREGAQPTGARRKRPVDCFMKLASCLSLAARVARSAGLTTLERSDVPPEGDLSPGDVLDLAALVTGELAAAHVLAAAKHTPGVAFLSVGRRTPSDVLELSTRLEAQLTALSKVVDRNPLVSR